MPFKIVRNDITKMQVDVIVNTANELPIYSTGTDYAVYKAAGEAELLAERKKIGILHEGEVAITRGFKLPAKYIIHAASPYYINGAYDEEEKLRKCYRDSLYLAAQYACKTIAFPLIATGNFGYPKEEAMRIALDEIHAFLLNYDMLVYLVVFDTKSTQLGFNLYPDLEAYIDHNYVCDKREEEYGDRCFGSVRQFDPEYDAYQVRRYQLEKRLPHPVCRNSESRLLPIYELEECSVQGDFSDVSFLDEDDLYEYLEESQSTLDERMSHMSDTYQEYLMYLIESKGLTNSEVYKRAFVTKQLFSKIKRNQDYHPDKATAMRLCIGAKLNLDETKDLLARAGYALSPCDKRDIIFSFFIEKKIFDMIEIDIVLEKYNLPCFIE